MFNLFFSAVKLANNKIFNEIYNVVETGNNFELLRYNINNNYPIDSGYETLVENIKEYTTYNKVVCDYDFLHHINNSDLNLIINMIFKENMTLFSNIAYMIALNINKPVNNTKLFKKFIKENIKLTNLFDVLCDENRKKLWNLLKYYKKTNFIAIETIYDNKYYIGHKVGSKFYLFDHIKHHFPLNNIPRKFICKALIKYYLLTDMSLDSEYSAIEAIIADISKVLNDKLIINEQYIDLYNEVIDKINSTNYNTELNKFNTTLDNYIGNDQDSLLRKYFTIKFKNEFDRYYKKMIHIMKKVKGIVYTHYCNNISIERDEYDHLLPFFDLQEKNLIQRMCTPSFENHLNDDIDMMRRENIYDEILINNINENLYTQLKNIFTCPTNCFTDEELNNFESLCNLRVRITKK